MMTNCNVWKKREKKFINIKHFDVLGGEKTNPHNQTNKKWNYKSGYVWNQFFYIIHRIQSMALKDVDNLNITTDRKNMRIYTRFTVKCPRRITSCLIQVLHERQWIEIQETYFFSLFTLYPICISVLIVSLVLVCPFTSTCKINSSE